MESSQGNTHTGDTTMASLDASLLPGMLGACSLHCGEPLSSFPGGGGDHAWDETVALGKERRCTQCWETKKVTSPALASTAPLEPSAPCEGVVSTSNALRLWCRQSGGMQSSPGGLTALCSSCRANTLTCVTCTKAQGKGAQQSLSNVDIDMLLR